MARGECPPHSPGPGFPLHRPQRVHKPFCERPLHPAALVDRQPRPLQWFAPAQSLANISLPHPILAFSSHHAARRNVKLIIAIIQPNKLEAVKEALTKVEVFRLTVMDCQGFGRQKGQTGVYRGHEFSVNLLRKVQLQIAVNEPFVQPTIDAILEGGRTGPGGEIGDGKIFVLPMDDCIRIRTGERGSEAI